MTKHSFFGELYVLKIGGSVLTDKATERIARTSTLKRISEEIAIAQPRNLILIHGAGSFGHPQAKMYLVSREIKDALITHETVKKLNMMMVSALTDRGLKAIPLHPLSAVVSKGGEIEYKLKDQIELALKQGIIPVLHGDIILDARGGFSILSGDQLVVYAAKEFKASRVGVGTDVDGVLDDTGVVIRELTASDVAKRNITGSEHVDVTGGMKEKVDLLVQLAARYKIPAVLFNATKESNVVKFLRGDGLLGTVITGRLRRREKVKNTDTIQ